MKNILSIDGWYFRVFSKLANLILLNLIFVVSILPIVTTGISIIALINSLQELKEDGSLSALKVFTAHFKNNLTKGLVLLVIEVTGFSIPGVLIFLSLKHVPLLSTLIMILFSFLLLLLVVFPFVYALNNYSVKEAFFQTVAFVTVKIAYAIAIFIIPIAIIFFSLKYQIIFLFLIGISLIFYIQLYFINKAGVLSES